MRLQLNPDIAAHSLLRDVRIMSGGADGDNSATLTIQYYKCADGENCLILPRKWC